MNLAMMIGIFVLAVIGTIVLGLISKGIDRKVTARVQWRRGPSLLQPAIDVIKLLGKETLVPRQARQTGFLVAPLIGFAAACVAAGLLWAANISPDEVIPGDLIVVWYLMMLPSIALIIGGASSSNPNGVAGASREMKLVLSYELPMLLAVATALVVKGFTFNMGSLVQAEAVGVWQTVAVVVGYVIALLCTQAKLGLIPFDIAEAETEIMGGVYTEYSGAPLAIFNLTRAMMLALAPIFLVTVFWGGFNGPMGLLTGLLKYLLTVVLIVLIRNTNPRLRIDQAMKFFWYGLTPVALAAMAIASIAVK